MTGNMSFRAVGDESHASFVRDISLSLNMTEWCVIQRAKPEESHTRLVRDISFMLNMTQRVSYSLKNLNFRQ